MLKAILPKRLWQRLSIAALAVAVAAAVFWPGSPRVRSFSWADETVTWRDRDFELVFSHAIDPASVETGLEIEPPLPGQWEWNGKRATYRLDRPAPYGLDYVLRLTGATRAGGEAIEPFEADFRSADRAIVYLGTGADESGALVAYNFTQGERQILTPADLSVMDYRLYPRGDRVLFSAIERAADDRAPEIQLYTVATGAGDAPAGRLDRLLDGQNYQNLQFDLALDGSVAVIQRADRQRPNAPFGLWAVRDGQAPMPIEAESGGTFSIAPNGRALAVAQSEGIAILPLDPAANASEPVAFFRDFGRSLAFSEDGLKLALLRFNPDYTRSIFLSTDLGEPEELLTLAGSVLDAQFDPTGNLLYCLLLAELDTETYLEQPRIVAIDLENLTLRELARLDAEQRDLHFDLSPDGQAIVFDRLQTVARGSDAAAETGRDSPRTRSGERVTGGDLQAIVPLLPLENSDDRPTIEPLGLSGIRPRWLP